MNFDNELLKQCWFLAGPTAVGKSATSLILAQQIGAEVISMDSMAIYRKMDIGTAKPDASERAVVPHHLIDLVDPHQEFSVAEYVRHAQHAAADVAQRGRIPLFVGGTGLYLRSFLRGVFEGPEADWDLRTALQKELDKYGPVWLHKQLALVDAVTAERLHVNDTRRVIRAIEVFRLTGKPLSEQHDQSPKPPADRPQAVFWLDPPRDWLHERVNLRVDKMMNAGLLQETRDLLRMLPAPGRTARQAIGYRELIGHIENDEPLEAAVEQIKTGSRQFAKRQHTWFRNMEECKSVPLAANDRPEQIAARIIHMVRP